jgi:pimeloyl-ACP methyl ester carboxylesterase
MTVPDLPAGATGHVLSPDGLRLHYQVHGAGARTLVVPLACCTLPDLAAGMGRIRIVGYDPRGRGRSDAVTADGRLGVDADVADLDRLRAALGLERIAHRACARAPCASLRAGGPSRGQPN